MEPSRFVQAARRRLAFGKKPGNAGRGRTTTRACSRGSRTPGSKGYDDPAYVGVHFGFEVQLDDFGQTDVQKTGGISGQPGQKLTLRSAFPVDRWNLFEVRVEDQKYTVLLNREPVTVFENLDPTPRGAQHARYPQLHRVAGAYRAGLVPEHSPRGVAVARR